MTSKICKKCKVEKQLDNYYAHKTTADRLDQICKSCKKAKAREWAQSNKEKRKQISKRYVDSNPEKRQLTNFRYYNKNKEKIYNSIKVSKSKKPEIYAGLGRKHANMRRARKLNNGQEPYTESAMLELYGTVCHLCESSIDMAAPRKVGTPGWELGLHVDHVIPLSKGGPDTLENVRPAHGKCNLQKQNMVQY